MYDPSSLMPQSDIFNTSQLFAQVAQNPEQYIPQLAAAGIPPPVQEINPLAGAAPPPTGAAAAAPSPWDPAAGQQFAQAGPMEQPGGIRPRSVAPTPQAPPPPSAPPFSAYGQTPTSPGMGEFADPVPVQQQAHPFSDVPKPASQGISMESAGPPTKPGPVMQTPQYPQTHTGPMPKSRDLAVVGKMEGGGSFQTVVDAGQGRRALGMFGILNTNLPQWGQKYAGRSDITEQEFLNNPDLQQQIAQGAYGDLRAKYGSGGAAARAWLAGEGGMNDPNRRDAFGTNPFSHEASYNKFNADLGGSVGAGGPARQGQAPTDLSSIGKPGEANAQQTAQAKLKTLAEMLRGVSKPTAPGAGPTPPSPGHAPTPPQGQKIEGNLMAYLTALLGEGGGKKKVENLTLNEATPRKL